MPRELCIEAPGAVYHILTRGDQGDEIVREVLRTSRWRIMAQQRLLTPDQRQAPAEAKKSI